MGHCKGILILNFYKFKDQNNENSKSQICLFALADCYRFIRILLLMYTYIVLALGWTF